MGGVSHIIRLLRKNTRTRHASAIAPTQSSTTSATRPAPLGDWCVAEYSAAPQTCIALEFRRALSCSQRSLKLHKNTRERRAVDRSCKSNGASLRAAPMAPEQLVSWRACLANFGCSQRQTEREKPVRHKGCFVLRLFHVRRTRLCFGWSQRCPGKAVGGGGGTAPSFLRRASDPQPPLAARFTATCCASTAMCRRHYRGRSAWG